MCRCVHTPGTLVEQQRGPVAGVQVVVVQAVHCAAAVGHLVTGRRQLGTIDTEQVVDLKPAGEPLVDQVGAFQHRQRRPRVALGQAGHRAR